PDPAPDRCSGSCRVAVVASGDQMNAMPTPTATKGSTSRQIGVVGAISTASQVRPTATTENPKPTTGVGWDRSTIRPAIGASTPPATAIGAISSAEPVGDNPHTACAKNIAGNTIAVTTKPMVATPTLASMKLRSAKICNGTSGWRLLADCQMTNIAITPAPPARVPQIHGAHRWVCASCSANTI